MAAEKILTTDTLDSGFRVKYNATVDTIINGDATIDTEGIIKFPKVDGSFWTLDIRSKFPTTSDVSSLVNPAIRQATETITGQVRKSTLQELVDGDSDFAYVSATGLKYMMDRWETLPHESFSIGESTFYINDIVDGDGVTHYGIGLDTYELMIEGDLEMAGKISVGQGYPIIEKRKDQTGNPRAVIDAQYSPLELISSNVNVNGILGVGTIESFTGNPIIVNAPIEFTYDLIFGGSTGLDHQFLKYNGTSQEWSYLTFGEFAEFQVTDTFIPKFIEGTGLVNSLISETAGVIQIDGFLNLTGNLLINGSEGVDHAFFKFNGTNIEWAVINTGELSDKLDIVMLVTDEGERGFKMYSDSAKNDLEGFVFTNSDTGIFGFHGYRLNGPDLEQYGLQIDKDTFLYHVLPSGARYRILTTNDKITGGGSLGIYSASAPLSISPENFNISMTKATNLTDGYLSYLDWIIFNGKQDVLSNASSTVTGKLTSTDWNIFNDKLGDGDKVDSYLDFDDTATLYFNKNPLSTEATGKIFTSDWTGTSDLDLMIVSASLSNLVLISGAKIIAKTSVSGSATIDELELGTNADNFLMKLNGTNFNFKLSSTPSDGDRFVIRYSSSRGGMILEAE